MVMASEAACCRCSGGGRQDERAGCSPGKCSWSTPWSRRIISDKEIKQQLGVRQPYAEWLKEKQITLDQVAGAFARLRSDPDTLLRRQRAFGYTEEDMKMILEPMASKGEEPIGSMGTDTPLACLSDRPQLLFSYFKQLFAQVTNPPIDPIREEMVMSLIELYRKRAQHPGRDPAKLPHVEAAASDPDESRTGKTAARVRGDLLATTLPTLFRSEDGEAGLKRALDELVSARFSSGSFRIHIADSFRPRRG